MKTLPVLNPGDFVELIAPASRCSESQLQHMKDLIASWQLNCIVQEDIFAKDLLCANTDEMRFQHLKKALLNPQTKAIICVRGGYGSMRLIPRLAEVHPPEHNKIFVGMSDTTALQLYLQQHWGWPTIHGAAAPDRFSAESIAALKTILFAERESIEFLHLKPLNDLAREQYLIKSVVTGGNLVMVQAGMATNWQVESRNKIILLEEINERAYRVDRMLEHLQQAGVFYQAAALVFADFLGGDEPDGTSLIQPVLERFAAQCSIPVVQMDGVGHGLKNFPVPCETNAHLELGERINLRIFINGNRLERV